MVQRARPEGVELFVQVRAAPGDLALGDAGVAAQGFDQVTDRAGGDAVPVGLHDDRAENPADAPPALQQAGR